MPDSSNSPVISILVVNWNTRQFLQQCLESIFNQSSDTPFEVIVVDNASTDDSIQMVKTNFPQVTLIQNSENTGFARANNKAARISRADYLLLLNSDAYLSSGALDQMVRFASASKSVDVLGVRLLNPDGSFQFSYADFPTLWREFLILSTLGRRLFRKNYPSHNPEIERGAQKVDYVNGACFLVRREIYEKVGGLPDQYFMYAEEVDFCLEVHRSAGQVWYHPQIEVFHHGSASSKKRMSAREGDMYQSRVRLIRKYRGNLAAEILKIEMVLLTAPKILWHSLVRGLSREKKGRQVISLGDLFRRLREV